MKINSWLVFKLFSYTHHIHHFTDTVPSLDYRKPFGQNTTCCFSWLDRNRDMIRNTRRVRRLTMAQSFHLDTAVVAIKIQDYNTQNACHVNNFSGFINPHSIEAMLLCLPTRLHCFLRVDQLWKSLLGGHTTCPCLQSKPTIDVSMSV